MIPSRAELEFMMGIHCSHDRDSHDRPAPQPLALTPAESLLRRAVRCDRHVIHVAPCTNPEDLADWSHAEIMAQAQRDGYTFHTFDVAKDRGWVDRAGHWIPGDEGDALVRNKGP